MDAIRIDQTRVLETASRLPGFPPVITEIIATIDDPDANLAMLTDLIRHDPVITARIFAMANTAALRTRSAANVRDIYTATSLIGLERVRQVALITSCAVYFDSMPIAGIGSLFWQHSVAVGVACGEVALYVTRPVSSSLGLLAGLLHDVGQLWLRCFHPEWFSAIWSEALRSEAGIEVVERERFGADHATIGAWLAGHWLLPPNIVAAIGHHHAPEHVLEEPLVPLVHVAEVLANALDLTGRAENRITAISTPACRALGLVWNNDVRSLFGRIEARSSHANAMFASG